MKKEFLPEDRNGRLFWLIEECGEVLHYIGKAGRFGMGSRHPDGGPTNAKLILGELYDLEAAIKAVRPDLESENDLAGKCRARVQP